MVWICAGRCPEDLLRVSRRAYGVTTDEAAPGADTGRRGLGLPLPDGAGTGPVVEISSPGQPPSVYPSALATTMEGNSACRAGVRMRRCRKLPAVPPAALGPEPLLRLLPSGEGDRACPSIPPP